MPYCTNCGSAYETGEVFCTTCGQRLGEEAQGQVQQRWDVEPIASIPFVVEDEQPPRQVVAAGGSGSGKAAGSGPSTTMMLLVALASLIVGGGVAYAMLSGSPTGLTSAASEEAAQGEAESSQESEGVASQEDDDESASGGSAAVETYDSSASQEPTVVELDVEPIVEEETPELTFQGITAARATSVYGDSSHYDGSHGYGADNVLDGVLESAWVEGAPGWGVGESITLSGPYQRISGFSIRSGYQKYNKRGDLYWINARPRDISVLANGSVVHTQTLADDGHVEQWVTFAQPVDTDAITIRIDSVYEGNSNDPNERDCCISEIGCY